MIMLLVKLILFRNLLLALICLLNFINIIGYLISLYFLNKNYIESKFPKLKRVKTEVKILFSINILMFFFLK